MKINKFIAASILATMMTAAPVMAQQPGASVEQNHCIGYKAQVASPYSGYESSAPLQDKIRQILARNSASEHANSQSFAIVGNIEVTNTQATEGMLRNTTIVYADFILEAVNLVDNNIYAATSVKIQAQDVSKEKAEAKLVQSIITTDPVYAKFIKSTNDKIIKHYDKNLVVFMNKAKELLEQGEKEKAFKVLKSIPVCVPAYEKSSQAIKSLIEATDIESDAVESEEVTVVD